MLGGSPIHAEYVDLRSMQNILLGYAVLHKRHKENIV